MQIQSLPSYEDVLTRLDSFHNLERAGIVADSLNGGSERMVRLMRRVGSLHVSIPAIHVAGTKGKGSVSHLCAAALTAAGLKTGLYTSPHVTDLRERIQINGRPIIRQRFIEAAAPVLHEAGLMRDEGDGPSWFEVLTAVAIVAFANARVDAMVLETGLGGRLDATNMPDMRVAAVGISTISKDHEEILGSSLEAIAAEKAAIIRKNTPVVVMPQEESAMRVITARAREMGARVFLVGKDVRIETRQPAEKDKPALGQRLNLETWRNVYPDIPVAMLGNHQAENAGLALGLTDLFLEYMDREPLDCLILKRAWRGLSLPARMEVVSTQPWHVVDGAHNPASAWAATETIIESFSATRRTLVFGVAADKNYQSMLRILSPLFSHVILTPFASPRATPVETLAKFVRKEFPDIVVMTAIDPSHALTVAESVTPADGLILSTGSMWLAGEVRALMQREKIHQGK